MIVFSKYANFMFSATVPSKLTLSAKSEVMLYAFCSKQQIEGGRGIMCFWRICGMKFGIFAKTQSETLRFW
jgi:hypothetical protein